VKLAFEKRDKVSKATRLGEYGRHGRVWNGSQTGGQGRPGKKKGRGIKKEFRPRGGSEGEQGQCE
jgi:hypothetical protein